jgi:hypothetical protein
VTPSPPSFPTSRAEIAGIAVVELARRFGTPTFVYDAAVIVERLHELAAFDTVRYAQKACSSLAILDLLRRHGAAVDAVSAGEIRRALAAGYALDSPLPLGEGPGVRGARAVSSSTASTRCTCPWHTAKGSSSPAIRPPSIGSIRPGNSCCGTCR